MSLSFTAAELAASDPSGLVVMKCLSLWEPWASLMACGAKTIETRSWRTHYRGPLLICASKRRAESEVRDVLENPAARLVLRVMGANLDALQYGNAVAVVSLIACVPTEDIGSRAELERMFGNYAPGRFAWITTNLRQIKPFPISGHQGLWNQAVRASQLASA